MTTYKCKNAADFERQWKAHCKRWEERVQEACMRSLRATRNYIIERTLPIAFGGLRKSLQVRSLGPGQGGALVSDCPYALAVEAGSRPHIPPLEPLVRWVKLRGLQGGAKELRGSSSHRQARTISGQLNQMAKNGANSISDPVKIARSIQHAIAKYGSQPHWWLKAAVPFAFETLDKEIKRAYNEFK